MKNSAAGLVAVSTLAILVVGFVFRAAMPNGGSSGSGNQESEEEVGVGRSGLRVLAVGPDGVPLAGFPVAARTPKLRSLLRTGVTGSDGVAVFDGFAELIEEARAREYDVLLDEVWVGAHVPMKSLDRWGELVGAEGAEERTVRLDVPETGSVRVRPSLEGRLRPFDPSVFYCGMLEDRSLGQLAAVHLRSRGEDVVFERVEVGVTFEVAGTHPGYDFEFREVRVSEPGEEVLVEVRFRHPRPLLHARLVDPLGRALVHREVHVEADPSLERSYMRTDAHGAVRAQLPSLHPGAGRVTFNVQGEQGGYAEVEFSGPTRSGTLSLGSVRLRPHPDVLASGVLVDEQGEPVPDARVGLGGTDRLLYVTSGADGRFELRGRRAKSGASAPSSDRSSWTARVYEAGLTSAVTQLTRLDQEVRVSRSRTVRGVLRRNTERPVALAVRVESAGSREGWVSHAMDGRFAVSGLPSGEYRLFVDGGGRELLTTTFKLSEDETVLDLGELDPWEGWHVLRVSADEDGRPVERGSVSYRKRGETSSTRVPLRGGVAWVVAREACFHATVYAPGRLPRHLGEVCSDQHVVFGPRPVVDLVLESPVPLPPDAELVSHLRYANPSAGSERTFGRSDDLWLPLREGTPQRTELTDIGTWKVTFSLRSSAPDFRYQAALSGGKWIRVRESDEPQTHSIAPDEDELVEQIAKFEAAAAARRR